MPRTKRRDVSDTTAREIFAALDTTVLINAIAAILDQGGAIMLGQTRDQSKLILTAYVDGDQDKEYCDDVQQAVKFLGEYQV